MGHRYGRHGIDAWSRLRKRRLNRFTRSLVPQARIAVIHLHINFANRERIFIVELDEKNLSLLGKELTTTKNLVDSSAEPASSAPDPLSHFKERARLDGALQARKDINSLGYLPLREKLRARAKENAMEYAYAHAGEWTRGIDTDELENIYTDIYLASYDKMISTENKGRVILFENEKKAQGIALRDKARDSARGQRLTSYRLDYQAAIRAQETLHLDAESDPDYISQIEGFVKVYRATYEDDKGVERDLSNLSAQFPEAQRF
jgi:hypothetical protein